MPKETTDYINIDTKKIDRVKRAIPDESLSQKLAELFKILSDPTRLRILSALEIDELCVCDIATLTSLTQSLVSHHLQSLRHTNIVKYRRDGKMAFYSLNDSHIRAMLAIARDHARD
jgi:ArsR family transcriptional regulator, lead/cadmium/zinc/bismuth-responsive transcriptional repressor